jgi:hypothetical protein
MAKQPKPPKNPDKKPTTLGGKCTRVASCEKPNGHGGACSQARI